MNPEFLLNISLIWSFFHILILFIAFYETRFSKRKTLILTGILMGGLVVICSTLILAKGVVWFSDYVLLICTIPSLLFFWWMSSQRDGRFVFTFCLVDTVSAHILIATNLLNYFIMPEHHYITLVSRLLAFPILEYLIYIRFRKPYLEAQRAVSKGWGTFALVSILYYLLLYTMSTYPSPIIERPDDIPATLLLLVLMPLMYFHIFQVLMRQQRLVDAEEQMRILHSQANMINQRVNQMMASEQQMAIQRHDLHHRLNAINTMLQNGDVEVAMDYIASSQDALSCTKLRDWCENPVLNAIFNSYFEQAETSKIRVKASISIPNDIPIHAVELSTVFANALENAIFATKQLPEDQRIIYCKCICEPQLIFSISNPYKGKISFDSDGYPVSPNSNHGVGTKSIAAYCHKYNATSHYKAEDGWFQLKIVQNIR